MNDTIEAPAPAEDQTPDTQAPDTPAPETAEPTTAEDTDGLSAGQTTADNHGDVLGI